MIEHNMITSTRISLLESQMNQQRHENQYGSFKLDLPSIEAYHAKANEVAEAAVDCHCGLVPAARTVLAQGPDLCKMFLCCLQKGSNQCSFFKWKGGSPAEVLFQSFKFVTLLFIPALRLRGVLYKTFTVIVGYCLL